MLYVQGYPNPFINDYTEKAICFFNCNYRNKIMQNIIQISAIFEKNLILS